MPNSYKTLKNLNFDNAFSRLGDAYHSRTEPTAFDKPARLLSFNPAAARLLDMPADTARHADFARYFSGEYSLPGSEPLAMVYSGHQFGQFAGQLGDGRAILLGQIRNQQGELWDLHLKGAGQTPYSRNGDGRAVLRSSIREYLCSEAMHGLGIPTTRALCLLGSDEEVYREQLETAAMVTRVAPSHLRFGHFEHFYYHRQHHKLAPLADYLIAENYPDLQDNSDPYSELLRQVLEKTAGLIAQWQAVGFCHGVMNTDNMSMLGLTIDYGPFGFLDAYDSEHICNHSDHSGRYAYRNQPSIAHWNLSCLAQSLLPILDPEPQVAADKAQAILDSYPAIHQQAWLTQMRGKLGLHEQDEQDHSLINDLLDIMENSATDFSIFFRHLATFDSTEKRDNKPLCEQFCDSQAFDNWATRYRQRLAQESMATAERRRKMNACNPKYVLRNHMLQTCIEAAEHGSYSEIDRLLRLVAKPFDEQPDMQAYAAYPPEWANSIEVSCSS